MDIRGRRSVAWLVLVGLLLTATVAFGATIRRHLGEGRVATLAQGKNLHLEAPPLKGEGLLAFTRRLTGGTAAARAVSQANNRPRRLLSGVRYRVPYEHLTPELQLKVVRALFPDSQKRADAWSITIPTGFHDLSLWSLSEWFTGTGTHFQEIGRFNRMNGDYGLVEGQVVLIPKSLLQPIFQATLPAQTQVPTRPQAAPSADTPADPSDGEEPDDEPIASPPPATGTPLGASPDARLTFDSDRSGHYAIYRLERGEALYSAVVVRFIGAVRAKEVNQLAQELAQLNGIRDVTDMPVGQPIRIPFDMLLPEFLPSSDPRRQEWEKDRAASAKYSNTVQASRLEGITVILDAGHGGEDSGTNHHGTWESVYVYDVMLRVKSLLEAATAADVVTTTIDDAKGYQLLDRDELPISRRHRVLTHPPYPIRDARVSAHLRWYLANSRHRKAVKTSRDSAKTIFLSIHADSLHQSLRGAMVYVPSTSLTSGTFGKSGSDYTSRREVKEQPKVSFSWKERTRSEGLSRQMANSLLSSFRRHSLAVHHEKPIRDRIIRCRRCRPFVPAVVRYNEVPTKLLLEICNMNNSNDRALLRTKAFRQRVATAIVDGILDYYGQPALSTAVRVAESP